ncbi:NDR1/HIN1-like protein 13 [Pyrus x bretschneideri]|uniref:NDR1/HIN1-like protein 13 n=1 Tax=Pyrus x bretschneideri TaxID=225117 RepID=UPI00202E0538|nr:NDR1/HIN1-like protein 13 [Pyrus x bretschneideri]
MSRRGDTNPHFVRPYPSQYPEQLPQTSPHSSSVPLPEHHGQHHEPPNLRPQWPGPHPPEQEVEPGTRQLQPGRRPRSKHPAGHLVSFHPVPEEHPPRTDQQTPHPDHEDQQPRIKHPGQKTPLGVPMVPASHHGREDEQHRWPYPQGRPHSQHTRPHGLHIPRPQKTNFFAWSGAICCAIFWVLIILTGLVVLIVYLVFRPRTPKFDVSSATLNAAYLDMGYLLNADVTVLANFTNPNKKVSVDFSNLIIDLYYGNTRVATQYIEPFSASRRQSMFANVHMVASQVRLGVLESIRLKKEMEIDRARFEVKGYFRARANFGKILRYSYWLHGDCQVVLTRPPDGVLVTRKCKTKH